VDERGPLDGPLIRAEFVRGLLLVLAALGMGLFLAWCAEGVGDGRTRDADRVILTGGVR
jgi:hypothetical protein